MTRKQKQKRKIVRKRHQFFVSLANIIIAPFLRRKIGYKSPRINVKKYEPFLVVSNHVSAFDPILVTGTFNRQVYYVASELIFSKGLISRILEYTYAPIPKAKSQTDVTSVKQMIQVVKEGGNVGVFVEGNSTINGAIANVPAAIGKLVLLLKIPLIIFNFEGGYLSNPRWSTAKRKGDFHGYVEQILTYDEYKDMSVEEINKLIIDGINVNAYDQKNEKGFPGIRNAQGLERLLFTCPKCQGVNTVSTAKSSYSCAKCGFLMNYDVHGYLHSSDFSAPKNTIELDEQNKLNYQEHIINNPDFSVSEEGMMTEVFRRRRKHFGKTVITLSREGLAIDFKRKNLENLFFTLDEIDTMAMQQKEVLVIYLKREQTKMLLLDKKAKVSSYQFLVTIQILKQLKLNEEAMTNQKLTASEMGL